MKTEETKTNKTQNPVRKMLMIADENPETRIALVYAANRVAHMSDAVLVIMAVVETTGFEHWLSVSNEIRKEAYQRAQKTIQSLSKLANQEHCLKIEEIICEGDTLKEISRSIDEDEQIKILILGSDTTNKGPGPLILNLVEGRIKLGRRRIPITVVPGDLTPEDIRLLS